MSDAPHSLPPYDLDARREELLRPRTPGTYRPSPLVIAASRHHRFCPNCTRGPSPCLFGRYLLAGGA